jgi:transcriptional regulator with XRE-family HTH domain
MLDRMSNRSRETGGTQVLHAFEDVTPPVSAGVGEELRRVRKRLGFTLAQVAEATNISKSFLSLVEAGKSDITIGRLVRLVHFYGISVTDLLPEANGGGNVSVVRRDSRRVVVSPAEGIEDFLLAPNTERAMLPILATFAPDGRNVEPAEHDGEEFVYVLKGTLLAEIEGHEPVVLRTGDSLYFTAELPHSYANGASGTTEVLFVITPPHL